MLMLMFVRMHGKAASSELEQDGYKLYIRLITTSLCFNVVLVFKCHHGENVYKLAIMVSLLCCSMMYWDVISNDTIHKAAMDGTLHNVFINDSVTEGWTHELATDTEGTLPPPTHTHTHHTHHTHTHTHTHTHSHTDTHTHTHIHTQTHTLTHTQTHTHTHIHTHIHTHTHTHTDTHTHTHKHRQTHTNIHT